MKAIKKIISVTDTRTWIEDGDRWIAVAGSGTTLQCAACGRDHEIHATVLLEDESVAVVGTGCAKGEFSKSMRSRATKAKTTARKAAQIAEAKVKAAEAREIIALVEIMDPPEVEVTVTATGLEMFRMGTATVWSRDGLTEERASTLTKSWRRAKAREMGAPDLFSLLSLIRVLETGKL